MIENMIWGTVVGIILVKGLTEQEKRPNIKGRTRACWALEQAYTPEKFTPHMYNKCLEHGPERAISMFEHKLYPKTMNDS